MTMTTLTLIHLLGIAFGLGIATGMDVLLMRMLFKQEKLLQSHYEIIHVLSKFVTAALAMLWISGFGFLIRYYYATPHLLANPKIASKVMIVSVLTLNGILIHFYILPKIKACIGKRLFSALSFNTLGLFFVSGAISMISWYGAFFYGAVPQLNFAFSLFWFSLGYMLLLSIAITIGLLLLHHLYYRRNLL